MSIRSDLNHAGLEIMKGNYDGAAAILQRVLADPGLDDHPAEKFEALALLTDCHGVRGRDEETRQALCEARKIHLSGMDFLRMGHHLQVVGWYEAKLMKGPGGAAPGPVADRQDVL